MSQTAVVIPAYNAGDTIARAVRSALDQRPEPGEVIVASDGSTDNTCAAARDAGAKVLDLPKANANVARNAAARLSSGDVLFLLDADDWLMEGKLQAHLEAHGRGNWGLVMDPGTRIYPDGSLHGLSGPALAGPLAYAAFTSRRHWYGGSSFSVKRQAFDAAGGFREELTSQQDLDFWIRVCHLVGPAYVLGQSYTYYASNPGSLSRNPRRVVPNMMRLLGGLPFLGYWDRRRLWCHVMFNTADQLPFPRSLPYLFRALDRCWDPRCAKSLARSLAKMVAR